MNLFEFENSIFDDVWNDKTIKELQVYEPPEGTGTIKQDTYYCWRGTRIPQWFE